MAKRKFDIYNIEIDNSELYLMKDFIDMYDDCNEKFKEYNDLIDELKKNKKIKKQLETTDDMVKALNQILNKITKEIMDSNDKEKLENLKEEYTKYSNYLSDLNKYEPIIKIYNEMYASNLSKYFDEKDLDKKIEDATRIKYSDYTEEELEEQIRIEKNKYSKKKTSTLTQVYINTKYLYEVCSKIYETRQNKVPVHGLISMIKTKIQKLKLKKSIKEINQAYVKDNEMYLARVKADETLYIDMESFEKNLDFFKMFKEPMNKYVNNSIEEITKARKKAEKLPEEIKISENVTVITRKEQIEELKKAKEELTQPEEIYIPTKTA